MEQAESSARQENVQHGKLLRILGVGFGLAVAIGGTVGVGILRNPSGVAAQLGSYWLIMFAWVLGGVYCVLGANLSRRARDDDAKGGWLLRSLASRVWRLRRVCCRLERLGK